MSPPMSDFDQSERCIKVFLSALRTESTKENYTKNLRRFKVWLKVENYSDILTTPNLQIRLEDYIMFLKDTQHPNNVSTLFHPIQTFLEMNDVMLNFKKVRRLFPAKVKTVVERGWTTDEIKRMLQEATLRTRAIILCENASGGRIGVFDDLRMKHLVSMEDCMAILGYAGEKEEYTTFLNSEAVIALTNYHNKRKTDGEIFTPETPVFRTEYAIGSAKAEPAPRKSLATSVWRAQREAGLRDPKTKKGSKFAVPTNHGFRHRFDEIIKSTHGVNAHLAEKMFAHTSRIIPLDGTYLNPTVAKMFNEYKKIIPAITIDDSIRNKIDSENNLAQMRAIKAERSMVESMYDKISDIEESIRKLQQEANQKPRSPE